MATGIDPPTADHLLSPDSERGKLGGDEELAQNTERMNLDDTETLEVIDNPAQALPPSPVNGVTHKEETKQKKQRPSPLPSLSAHKTSMTNEQLKYSDSIMKNLKKHRDAKPFLKPVDFDALNLPDYPRIVKHPMDFSTVSRKLAEKEYKMVEDFVADVRLVFSNCYKFNGPESPVSLLCANVEAAFEKGLPRMPHTPPPSHSHAKESPKSAKSSRGGQISTMSPQSARRMSEDGRPRREIHPPPSKDYPETLTRRGNNRKNDIQMRFCDQALRELKKAKYRDINYPFLEPVDAVALNIPDYFDVVKKPMDMSTIEAKLKDKMYDSPEAFETDIRLMFSNCYIYNPPTLPVHKMARDLENVFNEKWKQRPLPPKEEEEEDEDEVMAESDQDERDHKIAELERHLATITQQIASMKGRKKQDRGSTKVNRDKKPARASEKRKRPTKRSTPTELPEFTFEQKKVLSERINNLTGDRLNTVVSIIQSSMPNLDGQGQEEIVLDIDALDRTTLHRLHEFVTGKSLVPQQKKTTKKARTDVDADRKIQQLEKTLQKFSSGSSDGRHYGNDSSSESDSEGSSGSDSDDSGSSSD